MSCKDQLKRLSSEVGELQGGESRLASEVGELQGSTSWRTSEVGELQGEHQKRPSDVGELQGIVFVSAFVRVFLSVRIQANARNLEALNCS